MIHVAARTVATHALSIFGDHFRRDGRPALWLGHAGRRLGPGGPRPGPGRARLHIAARVPFLHFFDGFLP